MIPIHGSNINVIKIVNKKIYNIVVIITNIYINLQLISNVVQFI